MLARLSPLRMRGGAEAPGGGSQLFSVVFASAGTDDPIEIGAGMDILMDVVSPSLGEVSIEGGGILRFSEAYEADLVCSNLHMNGGKLYCGSEGSPFTGKAYITLTGAPEDPNDGHQRSIMTHGDTNEFVVYANDRGQTSVEICEHIEEDGESAVIDPAYDISGWRVGDEIVIGPTDWYSVGGTEKRTITAIDGQEISWTGGVPFRWGLTQYATDSGLSLTPDTFTAPSGTPTTLNERAVIGNLTRNFVIRGINDSYWTDDKHGCHVMVMDQGKVVLDGVEIQRGGQAGHLGRYPFHWHLLSRYPDGHAQEGDSKGAVPEGFGIFRNGSINVSVQRAVVIHGTDGVVADNNVAYDVLGHAFFLEGASEVDNFIRGNAVFKVRAPASGDRLLNHDAAGGELGAGPTAYWNANPQNTWEDNYATDVDGPGFWNSFPQQCWADLTSVSMGPNSLFITSFTRNRANSCRGPGLLGRQVQINSDGDVTNIGYSPGPGGRGTILISRMTLTKNGFNAYGHYTGVPTYEEWADANNFGKNFAGKTDPPNDEDVDHGIKRCLIVGRSLNNANPVDPDPVETYDNNPDVGITSYHSTEPAIDNTFMHFAANVTANGFGAGPHGTDDYYENGGVERGTYFDSGNQYIDCCPTWRYLSPNKTRTTPDRTIGFVGALWDPHGQRFGTANRYHIYDDAFLKYGLSTTAAPYNGGTNPNGLLVADSNDGGTEFFGNRLNFDASAASWAAELGTTEPNRAPMQIRRLDSGGSEVGSWDYDSGVGKTLGNMHSWAGARTGRYTWRFPGLTPATYLRPEYTNLCRNDDWFLAGYECDVSADVSVYYGFVSYRNCTSAASVAAVLAGSGDRYYRDVSNGLLWIMFTRFQNAYVGRDFAGNWDTLYQTIGVYIDKV